jgi:hypothetical protein
MRNKKREKHRSRKAEKQKKHVSKEAGKSTKQRS